MTWQEVDFRERVWTVTPGRMKVGKEHRIPLSEQAIAIIEGMRASGQKSGPEAFIFRIGRRDPTVHGFGGAEASGNVVELSRPA